MSKKKTFEGEAHNYEPVGRKGKVLSDQLYIEQRLNDQIDWHRKKSQWNLSKFSRLKFIETCIAALIPLSLSVGLYFDTSDPDNLSKATVWVPRVLSALAGVYLAISVGFFELEGYETNAKKFKKLCKKLESQKFKYLSRSEPYDEEDAFPRLVFTVENELHLDVLNFFNSGKKLNTEVADQSEEKSENELG